MSSQTVSVEVLTISGSTATPVTKEPNVFYDREVVAVVHRAKEKKGGLVSNNVWIWRGKDAVLGKKEAGKVQELAGRFGTTAIHITQGSEPANLIHILGGVLAVRQGGRARWSAENTAMHRVHRIGDSIFVDEVDLGIWNLCSAYSYVVSILDALYVWHGRGSSEDERHVALAYAQSLSSTAQNVVEFEEGTEDEMFWLMLGEDGYANADHWKFRKELDRLGARLYAIDASKTKAPVQVLPGASAAGLAEDNVIVVDCRLEIFVLVTAHARGKRTDIQLGLFLAENICATNAYKRPFDPPIHVVILPSKLPLELRSALRLCNEEALNDGSIPDHMNVLPLTDALDHIQRRSWPRSSLSDPTFLPLALAPSMT
ncbi:hypothetical protein BU17DRAFT_57402 [Hysterangium stoloniferum]|nr:hypothetical protein BU17DRAFT_57402 [Hysterangium stoloniferum]